MNTTSKDRNKNVMDRSTEEEINVQSIECIKNWRTCDEKEKEYWANKFIMLNHHTVDKVVEQNILQIKETILEKQDLISYGYEGLLNIMEKFNLDNESSFQYDKYFRVQYYVRKNIDDHKSSYKISTFEKEQINYMNRLMSQNHFLDEDKLDALLREKIGISEKQLFNLKKFMGMCVYNQISLDEEMDNLKEDEFIDNKLRFIERETENSVEEIVIINQFIEYMVNQAKEVLPTDRYFIVFTRYLGIDGKEPEELKNIAKLVETSYRYTVVIKNSSISKMKFAARRGEISNWFKEE
ncbi:hypothetical protein [Staphylococcus simulans]|uniref:hypothetical protein n=4 Tax=Staphylococcus simulans TaxID=1286 RepID=UPI000D0394BB|nr:hypothetical protein [Staphylococcus simulans]AVO01056.1 hypothetical protein BI282_01010 [Staphylococcus simulans]AVO04007.1 hypothetical protein BI283_01010 [Staphylococcus simulans]AWG17602.1 hypothetical protein A9958_01010 [Staphylococcus simulans]AWI00571.1 hypothetical protein A7X73_01010 [Staphylococcus simulans]MCE5024159.1 hypothetical protein [Staphylococcus simulans]